MSKFRKRIVFYVIIIAINVLLIIAIEFSLRMLNVGHSTSVFKKIKGETASYLLLNRYYASQFFQSKNVTLPGFRDHVFTVKKSPDLFRIYVFGESTSEGFPYSKTESFPFQLEQILNSARLETRFEVINFSMSAITTYIGLKIAQEAVLYPPDLVILYFGHNEFIGNGGMGRFHSPVFQLKVLLSKLRLYQWLNSSLQSLFKKKHTFLMQEMAKKNRIAFRSPLYQQTLVDFENNYDSIIKLFTEKNIPVIGCGVVGNIKDVPPLSSAGVKADEIESALEKTFEENSGAALNQKIAKLVNDNAQAAFLAGRRFLSLKQSDLARRYLWRACDYDQLRFRAPSDINRIILKTCLNNSSTFIDFQDIIDKTAVHGITGDSQLLEHVHPNLPTTQLIAKTLADSIAMRFLNRSISHDMPVILLRNLVEKEHAAGKMMGMFARFPYNELHYNELHYVNPDAVGEIYRFSGDTASPAFSDFSLLDSINKNEHAFIRKCFREGSGPAQIHLKRGSQALESENYSAALRENLIAYNQMPSNYTIGNNLAVSYAFIGDLKNAESLLSQIYDRGDDDLIIYKNLWLLYNMIGHSDKARIIEKHLKKHGINTLTIRQLLIF